MNVKKLGYLIPLLIFFSMTLFSQNRTNAISGYQAEFARYQNCNFSSKYKGYTGTGYVEMGKYDPDSTKLSFIEWTGVDNPKDGKVEISFLYANGTPNSIQCAFAVDGQYQTKVTLEPTRRWDRWRYKTIPIYLSVGKHDIKLSAADKNMGPNVDKLEIVAENFYCLVRSDYAKYDYIQSVEIGEFKHLSDSSN